MIEINIPSPNIEAMEKAKENWAEIDKNGFSLGVLEAMIAKLSGMGTLPDEFNPAMVLMCGDHGV